MIVFKDLDPTENSVSDTSTQSGHRGGVDYMQVIWNLKLKIWNLNYKNYNCKTIIYKSNFIYKST